MKKIILITGATDGLGKVAAKDLAKKGHTVIIHGRNKEKAQALCKEIKTETGNKNVDTIIADLLSFTDVKRMAEEFKSRYERLDVLINNAGAMFGKNREVTKHGTEKTMTLNVYSPMLLTELLMEVLVKSPSARIINTSSSMHRRAVMPDFDDMQLEKNYSPTGAYATSKLYLIWLTRHMKSELRKQGIRNVTANASHPGAAATQFGQNDDKGFLVNMVFKSVSVLSKIFPTLASAEKGAATTIYLATSQQIEGVSGMYFDNKMKEEKPEDKHYSIENEKILWDSCMQVIHPYLNK
ncbi:SDR family NAD(P)-dependent oxidoreductase [Gottfriedia sp. NPDC056225]|uniref:SDR family NAD(P)-dependent oxidoreductase n=1 Tax=Gottfriedia sp. NPDC056225 TaxID=3345751 RepID=UPI0035D74A4F